MIEKAEDLPARAPEGNFLLIQALEKQTAAISGFTMVVFDLIETLRDLLEEGEGEEAKPNTYLNGDPIQR